MNKLKFVLSLTITFNIINFAFAQNTLWQNTTSDNNWDNPLNWELQSVPNFSNEVFIWPETETSKPGPTISSPTTANANVVSLQHQGDSILKITGGSLNANEIWLGLAGTDPNHHGIINISGGTINCSGTIAVGLDSGAGTINMTGGVINTNDLFVPSGSSAQGKINLDGGTINTDGLTIENGTIDIRQGELTIDGNVQATVIGYVNDLKIIAYNGTGDILIDYNQTHTGKTTVTARSPLIEQFSHDLYTPTGNKTTAYSTISPGTGQTVASLFTVPDGYAPIPRKFDSVSLDVTTFGQTNVGATLTLYQWQSHYGITINSTPITQETFTNIPDNSTLILEFENQTPGQFLLVLSNPVNNPIAPYAYDISKYSDAVAYYNTAEVSLSGQTYTPDNLVAESLQSIASAAQDFYAENFNSLTFDVFTYTQTSDSFDIYLYEWVMDYETSFSTSLLESKHYNAGDVTDNESVLWTLSQTYPAGHYLLVMSHAGGPNIGWWRYADSQWNGDTYTAFQNAERVSGDMRLQVGSAKTLDLCATVNIPEPFIYDGEILGADPPQTTNPHSYAPSHIFHEGKHKIWFCDWSSEHMPLEDAVWYAEKAGNLATTTGWSTPIMVHNINNVAPWAEFHTADPTILPGNYTFNSQQYKYALYFTTIINVRTPENPDYVNRVGLSFSNDGINFVTGPDDAVIWPDGEHVPSPPDTYETGTSAATYDPVTGDPIHIVFDSTVENHSTLRYSTDGINFSAPGVFTKLRDAGRDLGGQGPDVAYNHHDQYWYAVVKCPNKYNTFDGETRVLRSRRQNNLLDVWRVLKIIDFTDTGNLGNHNPGLGRNADGSLYVDSNGYMYVFFGTGTGHGGYDAVRVGQARLHVKAYRADITADSQIDFADFAAFAQYWLIDNCSAPTWCDTADIDHSSITDNEDLQYLIDTWLKGK